MRYILLLTVLYLMIACPIVGQVTSPLHQYMNAHSLINRPQVFQDLENNIGKTIPDKPGVRLQYFEEKITAVKQRLYQQLTPPFLRFSDTSKVSTDTLPLTVDRDKIKPLQCDVKLKSLSATTVVTRNDSMNISNYIDSALQSSKAANLKDTAYWKNFSSAFNRLIQKTKLAPFIIVAVQTEEEEIPLYGVVNLNAALDLLQKESAKKITEKIDDAIKNRMTKEEANAVLGTLITVLHDAGVLEYGSLEDTTVNYSTTLGKGLAKYLMGKLREKISLAAEDVNLYRIVKGPVQGPDLEPLIKAYNNAIKTLYDDLVEKIDRSLDQAESKVKSVLDSYVQDIFGAAAGLAVTSGQGTVDGGVFINLKVSDVNRVAVYFNGTLNKADTTLPSEVLFGLQVQWAMCSNFQIDGMAAFLARTGGVLHPSTAEGGIGLSYRYSEHIFGLEGYAFHDIAKQLAVIVGLSIKGTIPGSPSVLFGISRVNNDIKPVMQVGIPIAGK